MRISVLPMVDETEETLGAYGGFGDQLFLIKVGDDLYAANNVTLEDGQQINGLATFGNADDAYGYMGLDLARGISGDVIQRSFEEARQIAIQKPRISALLLFQGNRVIDVHYVR